MTPADNPQVQQLLEQLNGVLAPEPSSGLAPGWASLLGLVIVASIVLLGWLINMWRQRRYRRESLEVLRQLDTAEGLVYAQEVNKLLKRVAMSAYGRDVIVPLQGESWSEFLRQTANTPLDQESLELLGGGLYHRSPTVDTVKLRQTAEQWIRKHKTPPLPYPREVQRV